MIDEDTGQLIPDGSMDQCRGHCGIDTAGKTGNHRVGAHLSSNLFYRFIDDAVGSPVWRNAGTVMQKSLDQFLSSGRVSDLRMPLNPVESQTFVLESRDLGTRRLRNGTKSVRNLHHRVVMGHPN